MYGRRTIGSDVALDGTDIRGVSLDNYRFVHHPLPLPLGYAGGLCRSLGDR